MKRALVLGLALLLLSGIAVVAAEAGSSQEEICTQGRILWPGSFNYLGVDDQGYPLYLVTSSQSDFVTLFGYIDDPQDPDYVFLTQPAGRTLYGEPKDITWRGVTLSLTRCDLFIRYLMESAQSPTLLLWRNEVPNSIPKNP